MHIVTNPGHHTLTAFIHVQLMEQALIQEMCMDYIHLSQVQPVRNGQAISQEGMWKLTVAT
ncbi:hypothetical protein SDC9_192759 [bioreactor metagenome]|uniref:Uncharacterized protein n=1 Tax=bioreactor metagenome TaxID=1076179 RepID=A0A645I343_9ZZZZ